MRGYLLRKYGKVGLYAILPIIFFLIPTRKLESSRSICLIYNILGVRCPGCGMTRALSSAIHGRFRQAFHFNKLVVIILPLLAVSWFKAFLQNIRSA